MEISEKIFAEISKKVNLDNIVDSIDNIKALLEKQKNNKKNLIRLKSILLFKYESKSEDVLSLVNNLSSFFISVISIFIAILGMSKIAGLNTVGEVICAVCITSIFLLICICYIWVCNSNKQKEKEKYKLATIAIDELLEELNNTSNDVDEIELEGNIEKLEAFRKKIEKLKEKLKEKIEAFRKKRKIKGK